MYKQKNITTRYAQVTTEWFKDQLKKIYTLSCLPNSSDFNPTEYALGTTEHAVNFASTFY